MTGWPAPLAPRLPGRIVTLEPLTHRHADGLRAAAQRSDWTWMPMDASASDAAFAAWLAAALDAVAAGSEAAFTILDGDGSPIGSTRYLEPRPAHRCVEIGWTWMASETWGTGANVEAKLLLLGHAFDVLGCERVELKSDARNARSRAAMAKLPAQFEGIHRRHRLLADGTWRDSAWYSVIAEEWPAVRENLERQVDAAVTES